jgi:outer membrane protein assembly factor BamB
MFWVVYAVPALIEWPIYAQFFTGVIDTALLTLLFLIWWLLTRSATRKERVWGLLALFVGGAAAVAVSQKTLGTIGVLFFGLPIVFTAWAVWLLVSRNLSTAVRSMGLVAILGLSWSSMTLLRMDGLSGDLKADVNWRWAPKAEDLYLAELAAASSPIPAMEMPAGEHATALTLPPGDWPAVRGAARDGVVRNLTIDTDWDRNPPQLSWRKRVGPAWSSLAIIGERLFTQEQRGEQEAVVCLDTNTGHELWAHEDAVRFWDGQAGAGPRATPTFVDGKLYTLGATGLLNCLDAASGKMLWQRDIVADTKAPLPMWGFASSPLVVDDVVIVFAGGSESKGLVAYRAASGEPQWTAATGPISYGSPQPVQIGGETQILFLSDFGLVAVRPETGEVCWQHEAVNNSIWRATQPRLLGDASVLFGSEDLGLVRLDLSSSASIWSAAERWASKSMKPAYNDFVVIDNAVYGFNGSIFCCVDAETGAQRWKGGRYGHGQLLLLEDQKLLVILSEAGDVVLVAAQPERHQEIARFHALDGKTWNHPAIAHGRLYVRNDEQMACYVLSENTAK